MSSERLNDFLILRMQDIKSIFAEFDASLVLVDFSLMKEGMSNTGYQVNTDSSQYLLKLYSNTTDIIETSAYKYLKKKINVPHLFYYDGSKQRFPYIFTIIEYLDGATLINDIRSKGKISTDNIYKVGEMCATLHSKKYIHDAYLGNKLNLKTYIPNTHDRILHLLSEKPSIYLNPQTINKLQKYLKTNSVLFERISAESVLCHGDLGYSNIMIIGSSKVYFIDFEYAYSGSKYHDIGHFFRRKDDDVQSLINDDIYNAFEDGYNSVSNEPLPQDWLKLAHLCDIAPMLCLLNRSNVPDEWVSEIECDILNTIS